MPRSSGVFPHAAAPSPTVTASSREIRTLSADLMGRPPRRGANDGRESQLQTSNPDTDPQGAYVLTPTYSADLQGETFREGSAGWTGATPRESSERPRAVVSAVVASAAAAGSRTAATRP